MVILAGGDTRAILWTCAVMGAVMGARPLNTVSPDIFKARRQLIKDMKSVASLQSALEGVLSPGLASHEQGSNWGP